MAAKITKTGPLKWSVEFDGWHAAALYGVFILVGVAIGMAL